MAKRCPACRQPVNASALLCVNCGYDRRTRSRFIRKGDTTEEILPSRWDWLLSPTAAAFAAVLVWVLFFVVAKGDPAATNAYATSVGVVSGTLLIVQIARILFSGLDFEDLLSLWFYPEYFILRTDYDGYVQSVLLATALAGAGIPILYLSLARP